MAKVTPKEAAGVFKGFKGAGAQPGKAGGLKVGAGGRAKTTTRPRAGHGTSSGPGRRSGY
jgi:hypothetical protein